VNLYLQALQEALESVFGEDAFRFCPSLWPNEKSFAVALMHDVDQPFRGDLPSAKRLTKSALKHFPVGIRKASTLALRGIIKQITRGKDPYFNFQKYMDMEEIFGFRSSFNLVAIPAQRNIMPHYDPNYNLNHRYLRMALDEVKGRGFEIGIHISYLAAENRDSMKEELSCLEKAVGIEILGGSLHYLRLKVSRTWEYLSDIGLAYDTSMGYNDALGFRAGWAHPYLPYSFDQKRALTILSLPLVIMDGVLFDTERLSVDEATLRCIRLLEQVKLHKGIAVILWHLRTLDSNDYPGWGEVYRNILDYLSHEDAWVTSPGKIARWWLSRIDTIRSKQICAA
jgi:peptidoglycan/xylan/chitin deacetylase (PgdA/CDA1 family)